MAYVTKNTGRWTININKSRGKVLVVMRWLYTWSKAAGVANWDYEQRKAFHTAVDRTVWRTWSHKVKLRADGASRFSTAFRGRDITLDFDVKWVTSNPHWDVDVLKLPAGGRRTSSVNWGTKKIKLDTNDFGSHTACNDEAPLGDDVFSGFLFGMYRGLSQADRDAMTEAQRNLFRDRTCRAGFETIPHEISHALGDQNRDEYKGGSAHRPDTTSIVNIGGEIRRRHLTAVIDEMNTMIPDCRFRIQSIRN